MQRKLEICAGDYASAVAALRGGADRIELCSGLSEGGITPSLALIEKAVELERIKVHVLIRPRPGDFLYTHDECAIIIRDIRLAVEAGADGVVVGCLTPDGQVDADMLSSFVAAAGGRNVTFHRAFDVCKSPLQALQTIADCGCNRILTSGQAATATQGIPMIKELVRVSPANITIMAGSGVNPSNALAILREAGVAELHASARTVHPSLMHYRHQGVAMGTPGSDEYSIQQTSEDLVKALKEKLEQA